MNTRLISNEYSHGSSEHTNRWIILSMEMGSVQLWFELNAHPTWPAPSRLRRRSPEKMCAWDRAGGAPHRLGFGVCALSHCRVPVSTLSIALPEITWNIPPSATFPWFWESEMGHVCLCELTPWRGDALPACLQVQPVSHQPWCPAHCPGASGGQHRGCGDHGVITPLGAGLTAAAQIL